MATVKLSGTDYELRFTLGALKRIEEVTGKTLEQWFEQMSTTGLGVKGIAVFTWAGLAGANPELTQADVDELVDYADFEPLGNAIREALGAQVAPPPETSPNGHRGAETTAPLPALTTAGAPGNGKRSSRSGSTTSG